MCELVFVVDVSCSEVDKLTSDFRASSQGLYCIKSRRTLKLPIDQRGCPVPFSGWLSDPARVVGLVYPPETWTRRGDQIYEIELVQMSFFGMKFIPVYELHILWHNNKLLAKSGVVRLRNTPGLPDWQETRTVLFARAHTPALRVRSRLKL